MIELAYADSFPVVEVVAGLAVRTEPSFVLIIVAGDAVCGKAEKRTVRTQDLDEGAFLRRYVSGVVALDAWHACMLALKRVAGFFMVEGFRVPLDQGKVFPVVLGVAAGAFLARTGRDVVRSMQSFSSSKPLRDFCVAVQTLQSSLPTKFMATRAVG